MLASNRKQLNVRSDEAYEIAHNLAKKLGKTTTEVVVTALRQLEGRRTIPSTKVTPEEAEANLKMLMEAVEKANPGGIRETLNWENDVYDEHGLPK